MSNRKTKFYTGSLSAVVLGSVLLSAVAPMGTANAVLEDVKEVVHSSTVAGQTETVKVSNTTITDFVAEAEAKGFTVKTGATKSIETSDVAKGTADIEANYVAQVAEQAAKIAKYEADYKAWDGRRIATEKANADETARYAAEKEAYDKAKAANEKLNADGQAKVDAENAAEKARVDAANAKKLADWEKANQAIKDENTAEKARIDAKNAAELKAWEDAKAEVDARNAAALEAYNMALESQKNGDVRVAESIDNLATAQPFVFNNNANNLISISQENARELGYGENPFDTGNKYNSEGLHKYQVNPGSVIRTDYREVATDIQSGRKLNVRVTYDNFHVTRDNTNLPAFGVPAEYDRSFSGFSNFMDAAAISGVTKYDAKFEFYYTDNGDLYEKPHYLTTGSLHGVKDIKEDGNGYWTPVDAGDPTGHYEFSAPVENVHRVYIKNGSIIDPQIQPINTAEGVIGEGYMIKQGTNYYYSHGRTPDNGGPITDTSEEALSKLGVTYFVENGAKLSFGVSSAVAGQDYDNEVNWYRGGPLGYNHVMFAADTIAEGATPPAVETYDIPKPTPEPFNPKPELEKPALEPFKPKTYNPVPFTEKPPVPANIVEFKEKEPQKPELNVYLMELIVPLSPVVKEADEAGKTIFAGEETTQRITLTTTYNTMTQFVLGDNIYYTEDGRMPVSVDESKLKVTQGTADGEDVTNLFDIAVEDVMFEGSKVKQILATAKDPASLPKGTAFVLHVSQVSLDDRQADDLIDRGIGQINGVVQFTDEFIYHEPGIDPHKEVTNAAGKNIDGKTVMRGDRLDYNLLLNAKDLTNTKTPVTKLGITDNYDETKWAPADVSEFKVFKVVGVEANEAGSGSEAGSGTGAGETGGETGGKTGSETPVEEPTQAPTEGVTETPAETPAEAPAEPVATPTPIANIDMKPTIPPKNPITYGDFEVGRDSVDDVAGFEVEVASEPVADATEAPATEVPTEEVPVEAPMDGATPVDSKLPAEEAQGTAPTSDGNNIPDNLKLEESAIDEWEITIDKETGTFVISSKDPSKHIGTDYVFQAPGTALKDATDGVFENTAEQFVNDYVVNTETVKNELVSEDPTKDVVRSADDETSINETEVALNSEISYKLESSEINADRGGLTENWTIVDDLNEEYDKFLGTDKVKVEAGTAFVKVDGTKVEVGADITEYFEVTLGEGDVVTVKANDEFIKLMNLEENVATAQSWNAFLPVERIKSGEVENVFTEVYNGYESNSNIVKTRTPEPPAPVVPNEPGVPNPPAPNTPVQEKPVPLSPAPAPAVNNPVAPKAVNPGFNAPTGEGFDATVLALAGVALAGSAVGAGVAYNRKRNKK